MLLQFQEGKDKKFLMNLLNQVRVRGRRVSKHPGPTLHKTMEAISPAQSAGELPDLCLCL